MGVRLRPRACIFLQQQQLLQDPRYGTECVLRERTASPICTVLVFEPRLNYGMLFPNFRYGFISRSRRTAATIMLAWWKAQQWKSKRAAGGVHHLQPGESQGKVIISRLQFTIGLVPSWHKAGEKNNNGAAARRAKAIAPKKAPPPAASQKSLKRMNTVQRIAKGGASLQRMNTAAFNKKIKGMQMDTANAEEDEEKSQKKERKAEAVLCGHLCEPRGVLVIPGADPRKPPRVIVADAGSDHLHEFSLDGQPMKHSGGKGSLPGRYSQPSALACDDDNHFYVADTLNDRVQKMQGVQLPGFPLKVAKKVASSKELKEPKGIAVHAEMRLLFVSDGHDRVVAFDTRTMEPRLEIGESGTAEGQFKSPSGLAIEDETLYVCDTGNDRIQAFSLEATPSCDFDRYIGVGVLKGPRAVAVTRGYLLIADGASEFDKSLSHGEPVSRILALSHADGTRLQSITITNGTVSSLCVGVGKCADLVFAADESQDALRVYKLLSSAPKRAKPASKKYAAVSPEKGEAGAAAPTRGRGLARWAKMGREMRTESVLGVWGAYAEQTAATKAADPAAGDEVQAFEQ